MIGHISEYLYNFSHFILPSIRCTIQNFQTCEQFCCSLYILSMLTPLHLWSSWSMSQRTWDSSKALGATRATCYLGPLTIWSHSPPGATHHLEPLTTWSHSPPGATHHLEPQVPWSHFDAPEATQSTWNHSKACPDSLRHTPMPAPKLAPKLTNFFAPLPSPRPLSSIHLSCR